MKPIFFSIKKLFLFLFFVVGWCSFSCAQEVTKGSMSILAAQEKVNMICDFDNCTVDKHSIEYAKSQHDDWDKGVEEIIMRFSEGYNQKSKNNCRFGSFPDAPYTLIYHLSNIDDDQDTKGTIDIIDTQTQEVIVQIDKANGSAGMFGSFFNLLGDAFENLGKKLAKLKK